MKDTNIESDSDCMYCESYEIEIKNLKSSNASLLSERDELKATVERFRDTIRTQLGYADSENAELKASLEWQKDYTNRLNKERSELKKEVERLKQFETDATVALHAALPYVKHAYECIFTDQVENNFVADAISSLLKK